MKANPLVCALLVLLAVAVQLPAQQPITNAAGATAAPQKQTAKEFLDAPDAAEQKISPSGTNAPTVPDWATLKSWEDFQIVEARQRYEDDARTNHIALDKPQYNNAPWSEIRLRASALKGDGLAASLCSGSNTLQELFWLSLAATNGWIPSQVRLARDFEYERPKDRPANNIFDDWEVFNPELEEIVKQPKAVRQAAAQFWWNKAKTGLPKLNNDAARNDARAVYALGLLHESGDLVESNAVLAAEMFHMAAKSGLPPAQESWGSYCDWHLTNHVEAASWYYRAATQGLMSAQSSLSFLHHKPSKWNFDLRFQPKACERARWLFEEASQPIACFTVYWAREKLGDLYFSGLGIQSNAVEAVKWYRRAIDLGIVSGLAEYDLALRYYKGDGVVKDYAEAAKWFRKAAEQNRADAQNYLGICYRRGLGVEKNYVEAVKWYRKAAEQGKDYGQYNLGICYRDGLGVEKNYVEAYKWENLAAASKDEHIAKDAVESRRWLESQMSPEQIAEGQRLSRGGDWEPVKSATDEFGGVLVGEASQPASRVVVGKKAQTDWGDVVEVVLVVCTWCFALFLFGLTFFRLVRYVRRMKMKRFGEMKPANLGSIIAKLIVAVMLFAAVGRHDYDYYTLQRCAAFGVVAFTAFQAGRLKQFGWLFVFVSVAVMLNPITPLHLKRETWAFVDAAAAVLLLVSISTIEAQAMNKSVKRFLFWCLFLLALFGIVACYFLSQNVPAKNGVLSETYINTPAPRFNAPPLRKLPPLHRK
jgi:TPR repeat protein